MIIGRTIVNISFLRKNPCQTHTAEAQGKQFVTSSGCIYHEPYAMILPGQEESDTNCEYTQHPTFPILPSKIPIIDFHLSGGPHGDVDTSQHTPMHVQ